MACFLGESGQLYSETTKSSNFSPPPHLSPQAINMTGSLTENFDAFTDLSCTGYLKHFLTQQFSSVCFSVTVPLSSDSFWSNLKSQFTGRSHRALFEESLKEIYRNMYNTVKEAHYQKQIATSCENPIQNFGSFLRGFCNDGFFKCSWAIWYRQCRSYGSLLQQFYRVQYLSFHQPCMYFYTDLTHNCVLLSSRFKAARVAQLGVCSIWELES